MSQARISSLSTNGKTWDTSYDWRRHAARDPRSVPDPIVDLVANGAKQPRWMPYPS